MEHCPRCGAELPAGANFCHICGARLEPQAPPPADDLPPPAGDQQEKPREPDVSPWPATAQGESPVQPAPVAPAGWRVAPVSGVQMLGPAAAAGIAGGFLVGVPGINACACLWMLGCGALAVFFFHKQFGRGPLPNEAAKLGVLSGFFGFLVMLAVAFVSYALIRRTPMGLVEWLRDNMERTAQLIKPDQHFLQMINGPGGSALLLFGFAAGNFIAFVLLSILGALLAGSVSRRRAA